MASIVLAPSDDQTALVTAIEKASAQNLSLWLLPGTHFTRPGRGRLIRLGANGLRISAAPAAKTAPASAAPIIKRPDHSIDLSHPDFNYGLFFVPAGPTGDELANAVWRTHTDGTFEYTVIIRGRVLISDLAVDCNMGQQDLDTLAKATDAEHSAMVGFAGRRYNRPPGPTGLPRRVYVAFESVTLRDLETINGGYADDVWLSRGYFNPNIQLVDISRLTSTNRTNPRRATVSFSGVCQNVRITKATIYKLEMEETTRTHYDALPRPSDEFTPSTWRLADVTADRIDLAAKGKIYQLNATRLVANESFNLYQAGGVIKNSTLRIGKERRLIRLDDFTFDNVTWLLHPGEDGIVRGLKPTPQYGDPCAVTFLRNTFTVSGAPTGGELITSEFSGDPDNRVTVTATHCTYPGNFGRQQSLPIARVRARGHWTFRRRDLGDRDPAVALLTKPHPDVVVDLI